MLVKRMQEIKMYFNIVGLRLDFGKKILQIWEISMNRKGAVEVRMDRWELGNLFWI